jgi:hypothetical protein
VHPCRRDGKDETERHYGRRRSAHAQAMSSKMLGCRILQGAAIAYQTRVLRVIALELVTNLHQA